MKLSLEQLGKNEQYTTPEILDAVTRFFGEIALDPCADPGRRTPAKHHYARDEGDDLGGGLLLPWADRTFVNPPYTPTYLRRLWVEKGIEEYWVRDCEQVWLVPASLDTETERRLIGFPGTQICFLKRVKFLQGTPGTGEIKPRKATAPFGSALVYLGDKYKDRFVACFGHLGPCVTVNG